MCEPCLMGKMTKTPFSGIMEWYISNVSIIFDAPCLFLHHLPIVLLHFVALLCIF
jgi:hypothetical protein